MKLTIGHKKKALNKNKLDRRLEELGIDRDELAHILAHECDPYNDSPANEISVPTKDGGRVTLKRGKTLRYEKRKND